MTSYKVVDNVSACQRAVKRLEQEEFIAVDSEGVNLSRTGPLTLLQIGTVRHRVYLFDVMREPRMFQDGGLKRLLESESVVKVLHSARNDGEALQAQHGVALRQVHDTQLAHMEVERAEGHSFPPRLRLEDVCQLYCPQKAALLRHGKRLLQTKLRKTEGEYWAVRPLTQEMIHYAVHDVMALIPEVFKAQTLLLEDHGLLGVFRARVDQDMRGVREVRVREEASREERQLVLTTLRHFASRVSGDPTPPRFSDIRDENVRQAFALARMSEIAGPEFPGIVRDLKLQQTKARLNEIEAELDRKGDSFEPNAGVCGFLHVTIVTSRDGPIIHQAKQLQAAANRVILEDFKRKYTTTTPLAHVAEYEKKVLSQSLRPSGQHDPSVDPVLLRLFWHVRQAELEASIVQYRKKPQEVSQGFVNLLKYYAACDVPEAIKQEGTQFLRSLEEAGVVIRPDVVVKG